MTSDPIVLAGLSDLSNDGVLVLPVVEPAVAGKVQRRDKVQLRQKSLILVHLQVTREALLKTAHLLDECLAQHQVGRTRGRCLPQGVERQRSLGWCNKNILAVPSRDKDVFTT